MKKLILSLLACSTLFAANAQNILGQGMESWHTMSVGFPAQQVEAPDYWFGADSIVFSYALLAGVTSPKAQLSKDAAAHSGSYAAKLVTKDQGGQLNEVPGILANAKINLDINNLDPNDPLASLTYEGGTAINQRFNHIGAWIKYQPGGSSDKAQIIARTVLTGQGAGGADSIVAQGDMKISSAIANYTYVEFPLTYIDPNVVPDKLLLIFLSSTNETSSSAVDGSTLHVDDVSALQKATGVRQMIFNAESFNVYPNPAKDVLNITTSMTEQVEWQAYNVAGQQVATQSFTKEATIDISNLAAGMYYYNVTDVNGNIIFNSKFSVVK